MTMKRWMVAVWVACGMVAGAEIGHAQTMDLVDGQSGAPLAIDAKGGIEWRQEEQVFIADGPATATRGDLVVYANELRAHYRDAAGGGTEVYWLEAVGDVRITTPGRVATGGHAIYDVDKAVIVLKDGNPVKLTAGDDVITATEQMEFWDKRNLAVARGDAVAVRADKRVRADVLTAHFITDAQGGKMVERIEGFDNVRIDTHQDQVFANQVAYNVPTGLARLTGSVKIKRGESEINGCSADIDLNTGISRMNSCEGASVTGQTGGQSGGQTGGRVHGVLAPKPQ